MPGRFGRGLAALFAAVFLFGSPLALADHRDGAVRAIEVDARPIPTFKRGSAETLFGPFRYLGGMQLSSPDPAFGGLSALRLLSDGHRFIAVSDNGYWLTGQLRRGGSSQPTGISEATIAAMRDLDGTVIPSRYAVDAEGLAIDGDTAFVSFERNHRIEAFSLAGIPSAAPLSRMPHPIPRHEFRRNRGMEAVAVAPADTPLDGAIIVISERSLNPAGDLFAAIVRGAQTGVFFVRRHPPFDVTDGAFLPNGDLLLLERRFSYANGVGMRIRRIQGADIRVGRTVDGPVLLEADGSYQIDNMESIEVYRTPGGATHVLLLSDNNHSLLQRTLLLEFLLEEQ